MVPTLNQKLRGHLEATTQVQCPSATVLDTNGTLSSQSPTSLEGGHTSASTQPEEESRQAQLPIQQGCLLSGTTIVPAASKATKQNLIEGKRPVQSSMQRGTGSLLKPEGCEKKPSVGLLEEIHGRRRKRQSTNTFCGSCPTLTQRPSTDALSLVQEGRMDLMESSLTTKDSPPPVTGIRVLHCRETCKPLKATKCPQGQLVSKLSVGFSGSGQSDGQSLCNASCSNPAPQPSDRTGTWGQSTRRFLGLRDKGSSGNWAKVVSPANYDRTMLRAERWPSIDESTTLSTSRTQAGSASQGEGDSQRHKGLVGNRKNQAAMERACPAGRRRHLSPLRQISWINNQDVGMCPLRSDLKCSDTSQNRAETNCLPRIKATYPARPHLSLKCIGKSIALKLAPKRHPRMLLPPLGGKKHSDKGDLLTSRGKRKWEKAAEKPEVVSCVTGNQLPTPPVRTNVTGFTPASCSQDTAGHRLDGFDQGTIEPVLLMVNKDFAVTSLVRKNLLLTIALSQNKEKLGVDCDSQQGDERQTGDEGSIQKCGQILVGQFTAFSSLMGFGLGHDARRVATEQNAGGSSTISETLSVEYFVRRFQARDIVTEMEVEYSFMNMKKVDYVCTIFGQRVGVSVTRAMSYPDPKKFNEDTAMALLRKKLFGLVVARSGVTSRHSFSQCILHVWCETRNTAKILEEKYPEISTEMQVAEDVIMVLTVAEGSQARPIFYEACLNLKLSSTKEFLWCF
eukprot:TRINITY_DN5113_c0_g1_i1.p1 TRINITY_DN5113_c0_g1~~TRINITY_DN5113_c0_g1_i1.p1  ORF type:complete len:735 (+),score=103.89 TRINITY_DN5113_c0_g1_i1:139-2343(+)